MTTWNPGFTYVLEKQPRWAEKFKKLQKEGATHQLQNKHIKEEITA